MAGGGRGQKVKGDELWVEFGSSFPINRVKPYILKFCHEALMIPESDCKVTECSKVTYIYFI